MSSFAAILSRMTAAAIRGDGAGVTACFTPDGVYNDVFYGSFQGAAISDLIEGHVHRDGTDFRWDIYDPISDGFLGYARYLFSFRSKRYDGRRAVFEGVIMAEMTDGLISEYNEIANAATGLSVMGMEDARLAKFIAKQAEALCNREEAAQHRE